ncbi:hydantoinase/oxoprolinase N-terminal domain-containing protein [Streptomyces sp. NPDC057889]|uniref:hydantoinase/oxoprolinase N-terminal domain-containing protein n=1 Tax=unclassified Streptomyces TaxID=2593676 RepID=UPI0036BE3458
MTYRVAMDIGGTFTDVVAYDETRGTYFAAKAPTTPGDLAAGVFASLGRAVSDPGAISFFVHGTTQGLNALLERKGAKVLLLMSEGMRDVYHIARGNRDRMFDLHYRKPVPLVDRYSTAEAGGRLDWQGTELRPLDEEAVRAAARRVRAEEYTAVAVSFLFSYVDPRHELRAGEILREELGDDVMVGAPPRTGGAPPHHVRCDTWVVSYADRACGRVASASAVMVRKFPSPTSSAWALCCAAGTRAITSAFRTLREAFIDWKA